MYQIEVFIYTAFVIDNIMNDSLEKRDFKENFNLELVQGTRRKGNVLRQVDIEGLKLVDVGTFVKCRKVEKISITKD